MRSWLHSRPRAIALIVAVAMLAAGLACLVGGYSVGGPTLRPPPPAATQLAAVSGEVAIVPAPPTVAEPASFPAPAAPAPPVATIVPSAASPTSAVESAAAINRPPDRNVLDLAGRFRPKPTGTVAPAFFPAPRLGETKSFWVLDQASREYRRLPARLDLVTDHLYMYVEEAASVEVSNLRDSARVFDEKTYPTLRGYFGSEEMPGIDGDPRVTILNARIPGVGGYFSSVDQEPEWVSEYSNQRDMVYINISSYAPGTRAYDATLAHEFMHMIQAEALRGGDTWVSEGTAELGAKATGLGSSNVKSYLDQPDIPLTEWAEAPAPVAPHYAASFLFFDYFTQHYGGYAEVGQFLSDGGRGLAGFDSYLRRQSVNGGFTSVFADWVVANYLNDPDIAGGKYGYTQTLPKVRAESVGILPTRMRGEVSQFGVDYFEADSPQGRVTVAFRGAQDGRLAPLDAQSGRYQWWSNRGDSVDSRLTREIDLREVDSATLRFDVWYDLERSYDYGFVNVSLDNGRTWRTLPGAHTTAESPNGSNLGNGYTGVSGNGESPRWVSETVSLSSIVGNMALLRFEYVTDDAFNAAGWGIDNISIPEIGFADDAESESGWYAEGWVRTSNRVHQDYVVRVILLGRETRVLSMALGPDNTGTIDTEANGSGAAVDRIVVVVAATNPLSTEAAPYDLEITPFR